jgi:hypothetical protein
MGAGAVTVDAGTSGRSVLPAVSVAVSVLGFMRVLLLSGKMFEF